MNYGYTGVEFEWGFHTMFMVGVIYEYRRITLSLGPLFLEWTW